MLSENIKNAIIANVAAGIAMTIVGHIFDNAVQNQAPNNESRLVPQSSYMRKTACTQTLKSPLTTDEWRLYYQRRYAK